MSTSLTALLYSAAVALLPWQAKRPSATSPLLSKTSRCVGVLLWCTAPASLARRGEFVG
jgi:hypothetical protein